MHPVDSLVEERDWIYYLVDETNANINQISGCSRTRRETNNPSFDQVRLKKSGVVEVKHLNEWGGICDEGFGNKEADVLCKQFGFEQGVANIGENVAERYSGTIHLFDLSCSGDEKDVSTTKYNKI